MDRLNKIHRAARVSLPASIVDYQPAEDLSAPAPRSLPVLPRYAGLVGFVAVGAVMIVGACLLALNLS